MNNKFGFFTSCFFELSLVEKIKWAGKEHFDYIEIGAWPNHDETRSFAVHDIDFSNLDACIKQAKQALQENHVKISALGYYENTLDQNPTRRKQVITHLYRCIDVAKRLDCPIVSTFIGRDISKSVAENFEALAETFSPILDYARQQGIKIAFENCVMEGWQVQGVPGTLCYQPELWEEIFRRLPDENLGINFDPSHLIKQFVDCEGALKKFKDRIFHFHIKDTVIHDRLLQWYGIYNRQFSLAHKDGFWNSAIAGSGAADWENIMAVLNEIHYDGVMSIENEDPAFLGSTEQVGRGILQARVYIAGIQNSFS